MSIPYPLSRSPGSAGDHCVSDPGVNSHPRGDGTRAMKIAIVTPGGFSPDGRHDVIPALLALTAELARGHDVHVFAFDGRGEVVRYPSGAASVHLLGAAGARRTGGRRRRPRAAPAAERRAAVAGAAAGRGDRPLRRRARAVGDDPGALACLFGRLLRAPVVVSVGGGEAVWLPDIGYGGAGTRAGRARTAAVLARRGGRDRGQRRRARPASTPRPRARAGGPAGDRRRPPGGADRTTAGAAMAAAARRQHQSREGPPDAAGGVRAGRRAPWRRHARLRGRGHAGRPSPGARNGAGPGRAACDFTASCPTTSSGAVPRRAPARRFVAIREPVRRRARGGPPRACRQSGTAVGLLSALAPDAARTVPPGDAPALADAVATCSADRAAPAWSIGARHRRSRAPTTRALHRARVRGDLRTRRRNDDPADHPPSLRRFVEDYPRVRLAEGYASTDPAFARRLPFRDTTGRNAAAWRLRALHYLIIRPGLRLVPGIGGCSTSAPETAGWRGAWPARSA